MICEVSPRCRIAFVVWCVAVASLGCGKSPLGGQAPDSTGRYTECTADSECDDGLVCSGLERCIDRRCVAGRPPHCDDGVAETTDVCVEPFGCRPLRDTALEDAGSAMPSRGDSATANDAGVALDGGAFTPGSYVGRVPADCEGALLAGDVILTVQDSIQQLQGVRCIDGDLIVRGPGPRSLSPLGSLRWVGGDVTIDGCTELDDLAGLDALDQIEGTLRIADLRGSREFAPLPGLLEVGGDLWLAIPERSVRLAGFASLTRVGGSLSLREGETLVDLSSAFPALSEVGGDLEIAGLRSLTQLHGFNALRRVGAALSIDAGSELALSGFERLERVGHELELPEDLTRLQAFGALERVSRLELALSQLTAIDGFHALQECSTLSVSGPQLRELNAFGALVKVFSLSLTALPALERVVGFGKLEEVSQLRVDDTALGELPFASLRAASQISLRRNERLQNLDGLSALQTASAILIARNPSLRSIPPLPALSELEDLQVLDNLALEVLGFEGLAWITEALEITANPALSRCQADAIASRYAPEDDEQLQVCCNLGCERCDGAVCGAGEGGIAGQSGALRRGMNSSDGGFAVFKHVVSASTIVVRQENVPPAPLPYLVEAGSVYLQYAPWTDVTALSSLTRVERDLVITSSQNLTSLAGLDQLVEIGGRLEISNNSALTELGVGALEAVGASVSIYAYALSVCQIEALQTRLELAGSTPPFSSNGLPCAGQCQGAVCQ